MTALSLAFILNVSNPIPTRRKNDPVSLYCKFVNVTLYVFGLYDTLKRPGNKLLSLIIDGICLAKDHSLTIFLVSGFPMFVSLK